VVGRHQRCLVMESDVIWLDQVGLVQGTEFHLSVGILKARVGDPQPVGVVERRRSSGALDF